MSETKNIKKMKAVRLHAIGDLRCDEMEVPVPKGEELLIKVGACGVCGSDYPRTYEHGTSSGIYPLTIGHEFAGEVVAAGSKENEALIGTKAAIYPLIPCRKCDPCVTGNYAMCEHYDYLGSRTGLCCTACSTKSRCTGRSICGHLWSRTNRHYGCPLGEVIWSDTFIGGYCTG